MVNNMTDLTAQDAAWSTRDHLDDPVIGELRNRFGPDAFTVQATRTGIPVVWVKREQLLEVGDFLKKLPKPYVMLFDLHGMDERLRTHRDGLPAADFSVFYHLISIERNRDIMLKVALSENDLRVPTFTKLFPNANWYERETWEMFGIDIEGHPHLTRIMMPQTWEGHPLRKDYPARATEFDPFELTKAKQDLEMEALTFKPEDWGMKRGTDNEDFMFLNLGPNHPSAHGAFRIILQLDGEEIVDCVPDIGYHHRGAEKMGERQSWHSYIPYTDRIEYLGGCVNEMPYVLAVEKLAGITVPDRVNVIRVMLSELFRINSHLLYISTFIQDVGAMTPVFFAFTDRQKIYDLVEAITGFRMHPAWFRIGGVAHDLPRGWDRLLREFLEWMPKRLDSYEKAALRNTILKGRSQGVAAYGAKEALEWGTTG
ncbi:NADH-quinone oxidoreductase subunit C/D, partial [Salmonella enterica subsp. enterica serovar Enteritidis]